MIKKRRNIKKEKLKENLLNEQQGFIVGNALIILPLIFSLIIAILVIVQVVSLTILTIGYCKNRRKIFWRIWQQKLLMLMKS